MVTGIGPVFVFCETLVNRAFTVFSIGAECPNGAAPPARGRSGEKAQAIDAAGISAVVWDADRPKAPPARGRRSFRRVQRPARLTLVLASSTSFSRRNCSHLFRKHVVTFVSNPIRCSY